MSFTVRTLFGFPSGTSRSTSFYPAAFWSMWRTKAARSQKYGAFLRPEGLLIVMMLPNVWSYTEFMARYIFRASDHDRRYTMETMCRLLSGFGFRAVETWYSNILPKNFTPLPERLRQSLGAHPHIWLRVEAGLSKIPPVSWFSGVVEGVFVRLPWRDGKAGSAHGTLEPSWVEVLIA